MSLRLPSRLHHLSSYTAHAQVSPTSSVINNSSRSTTDQGQKLAVNHVCYLICLCCFLLYIFNFISIFKVLTGVREVHMPSQTGNSFQPLTTSLETYTPRRTPTGDPLPTPAPEAMHMFDLLAITNIIDAILFIQSLGSAVFPNSHTHRKE